MKIEEIKFPLNIGTADTLTVQVRLDLETENSIMVYYAFIDTNQTNEISPDVILSQKMLNSGSFSLSGENYLEYKSDNSKLDSIVASILGVTILP